MTDSKGVEPMGDPNESDMLVTMSIEPESLGGGNVPHVHLGGTRMRTDDVNGPGNGADASSRKTDVSSNQADGSADQTDTLIVSNGAEMAGISCGEVASTYLGAGDAKRSGDATDGIGIQADVSTRHRDTSNVETDARISANEPESISIPREKAKPPDSPIGTTRGHPDKPNGCGNHADRSSVPTKVHSIGNEREPAANETGNVRTCRIRPKMKNSPNECEIAMPEPTYRWRKVSAGDGDIYVPWNMPVEVPSRTFVFGQVEGADEAIAPSFECEGAGDGDGDQDRDDGGVGGTTSGGGVHSIRVNAALLAGDSQHMHQSRRTQNGDLPVSSRPPTSPAERPYRGVRPQCRCGRIKLESIKVSQTHKVKTTYQERARAVQPPANDPKPSYRVIGLIRQRRRCGWIEIAPVKAEIKRINVKIAQGGETTHQICANVMQPLANISKHPCRVHRTRHRRVHIKIESVKLKIEYISINQAQEVEKTYLELAQAAQPPRNPSNCIHRVYRPRRRCGHIKS